MFAGVTTTAILMAFVADLLLSRRIAQIAGRRKVRELQRPRRSSSVSARSASGWSADLKAAGYDVVVIERDDDNRYLSSAAELDVPVIFGDATLRQTLDSARIDDALAVAVLTQDDMVNIETGIVLREMLGARAMPADRPDVPSCCGSTTARSARPSRSGSASKTSAPQWNSRRRGSSARRMGLQVLGTFSVGQQSFMVGGV